MWGVVVAFRGAEMPDFTPAETGLIERATAGVGAAIRREMVLTEIDKSDGVDGPGLLLLDGSLAVTHQTSAASRWLAEIEDGVDSARGLPYAVLTVAHRALAGPTRTTVRTRATR
jgi:hypothetical protein